MQKSTLVVDEDEARRRELVSALSHHGLRYLDVADAFGAMAALGRADFGAVVAAEGRRTLSLRGLCQLARRRHPDVVIFIIHRPGSDPRTIPELLGTSVHVLSPATPEHEIAGLLENALLGPDEELAIDFVDVPRTLENGAEEEPTVQNVAAPKAQPPTIDLGFTADSPWPAEPEEPTERNPAPLASTVSTEPAPLLEGTFDGSAGPALLLGLFSQELTGRLVVKDGPAAGRLYFYRGEPVWADDPAGDAGLHRRLVQKAKLPPDARLEAVPQGQLLGSLVQKGVLSGQQMHEFMRELVRDVVLAVASASSGAYRFEEDRKFLDVAPLLRVNPFGLVLEARRKSLTPAQLVAMTAELSGKYVVAGPGLGSSSEKLAPFVRGARLNHVIDGTKTVRDVLEYANLDALMGTLVMLSLRDTKLVSFEDGPRQPQGGVTLRTTLPDLTVDAVEVTLVDADTTDAPSSEEEERAKEEIFGLYTRLKPLTVPRQVLGVGVDADAAEIDAAYEARMKELDPSRIPEGSARQLLIVRIEELRRKVLSAYQALKLQATSGTTQVNFEGPPKTNPF
jgi:hypothetical protein